MAFPLGPLISGATSLIGGLFGRSEAEKQADLQKDFAQKGIQWRVADAKKAGVSPLYALGAQTTSYQPNMVGGTGSPMGNALADMGQDISRAVTATGTAGERLYNKTMQGLQVERGQLENELLKSQIARERGQVGPAMPAVTSGGERVQDPQRTTSVRIGGRRIPFDPGTSDIGQIVEDRYGEDGPVNWLAQPLALWNDIVHGTKDMGILDILREIDRMTSINKYGYK